MDFKNKASSYRDRRAIDTDESIDGAEDNAEEASEKPDKGAA